MQIAYIMQQDNLRLAYTKFYKQSAVRNLKRMSF